MHQIPERKIPQYLSGSVAALKNQRGYANEFLVLAVLLLLAAGGLAAVAFYWARVAGALLLVCSVVCLVLGWVYDPKRMAKK